jgi:hypothetical protein
MGELFDKAVQVWMKLEEDQQVYKWYQEEEMIILAIQYLNKKNRTMSIIEHVKGVQDMNKL